MIDDVTVWEICRQFIPICSILQLVHAYYYCQLDLAAVLNSICNIYRIASMYISYKFNLDKYPPRTDSVSRPTIQLNETNTSISFQIEIGGVALENQTIPHETSWSWWI